MWNERVVCLVRLCLNVLRLRVQSVRTVDDDFVLIALGITEARPGVTEDTHKEHAQARRFMLEHSFGGCFSSAASSPRRFSARMYFVCI